jgi:hypothetical protein
MISTRLSATIACREIKLADVERTLKASAYDHADKPAAMIFFHEGCEEYCKKRCHPIQWQFSG